MREHRFARCKAQCVRLHDLIADCACVLFGFVPSRPGLVQIPANIYSSVNASAAAATRRTNRSCATLIVRARFGWHVAFDAFAHVQLPALAREEGQAKCLAARIRNGALLNRATIGHTIRVGEAFQKSPATRKRVPV